ncbi:MAG: methyltransferase domain-containing protein [Minwuia sp.]|uniref:methyltransferase domain-containing protein n=1 Tax=Minwuia sp. TaxID=2493630 RepID=UPI003A881599
MSAQHEHAPEEKAGLWRRLNSWWGGEEMPSAGRSGAPAPNVRKAAAEATIWPKERLQVLEGLFGPGLDAPWVDEIHEPMLRELLLTEDSKAVVLGGGLGGPAARLAELSGSNTILLDDRVDVADLAQNWVSENGATLKVDRRDFFETGLKPGYADAIVAFGGFSHVRDKRRLFSHLLQILRPKGKIVFFDFFVTGMDPDCPEVAIWSALNERPQYLLQPNSFADQAYKIGFDYPDYRDVTDLHASSIRASFRKSVEVMRAAGPDAARLQPALVAELETWNRRLALIDSGEVRYFQTTVEFFGGSAVV